MPQVINTNIASINAQRNLNVSQGALFSALQRLSSGLRVNSAKDDAAGLAVAETLSSATRGNTVAMRNANDGISIGQTAEGALGQIAANIQRMREIAVQGANAGVNMLLLKPEIDQLQSEVKRVVDSTEFNGTYLLNGATTLTFQIGSKNQASHQLQVTTANLTGLTSYAAITFATQADAQTLIGTLDTDINTITQQRSNFGAVQNRFEAVVTNLQNYNENLTAAKSRIMDTDFAAETANMTRGQILQQSGIAMLAQANSLPNNVLKLLG
ncbi:MAG: flagellin [Betaproteobacteria bacterium]